MFERFLTFILLVSFVSAPALAETESESTSSKESKTESKKKPRAKRRTINLDDYDKSRLINVKPQATKNFEIDKNQEKPLLDKTEQKIELNSKAKQPVAVDSGKKTSILKAPGKVTKGTGKAIGGGFKKVGHEFGKLHGLLFGSGDK